MAIFRAQLTLFLLAFAAVSLSNCAQRVSVREIPPAAFVSPAASPSAFEEGRTAYHTLRDGNFSADAVRAYNTAVARVIEKTEASFPIPEQEVPRVVISDGGTNLTIEITTATGASWNLSEIQSLRAAEFLKIRGFRERIEAEGVGAPLVAQISPSRDGEFAASSGTYLPATAILEFSAADAATLTLFDSAQTPTALFLGKTRPLQTDYTAPIATTYAMLDRQRIDVPAMFQPDKFQDSLGLQQLGLVDPEKIPVVFVHGLKATPETWRDPINELMADPVIRDRFEFWSFGYTTGPAIPFSAMQMRESLQQMAAHRNSLGARTDDVVLVSHSMGGLIAGLMTRSSGDENWFKLFEEPLDELKIPEEDRDLLRRMAYYEPLPFVNRVIFIATPHGGSDFASNPISRVASKLIQIPGSLLTLSSELLSSAFYALTPVGRKIVQEVPTSIDTLQADSELVRLFREMPSNPDVAYHSIIGEDDPIVPYESTHFDNAVSEKLVPSGHEAHLHPASIEEVRRILREHVRE